MKTRESGMPDEETWRLFFDPEAILTQLGLDETVNNAADFGCGYGTFSIPAARRIRGILYGLDIDAEMIAACKHHTATSDVHKVQFLQRDFISNGTGLPANSLDYVMLFNILHNEDPLLLLREAWRVLRTNGRVAVIHWNNDPNTPRGPSMSIRPRPDDCICWIKESGFKIVSGIINLPPYHYGLIGQVLDK